ncbi:MAG: hypothetical protein AAGI38_00645 [Bacteroidota bacterium]
MKEIYFSIIIGIMGAYIVNAQTWTMTQKMRSSGQGPFSNLGYSVAISDSFVLAGAWTANGGGSRTSGAAYLYKRQPNGTWKEIQQLSSPNPLSLGYFGASVALTENYALVGAYNEGNGSLKTGAAYVYEFTASDTLKLMNRLLPSDGENGDRFGISVALTDEYALIGAPRNNTDQNGQQPITAAGAAYLFNLQPNGNWVLSSKWTAPNRETENFFGQYLDMDETGVVIGAFGKDELPLQFDVGTAYAYNCGSMGSTCDFSTVGPSDLQELTPADQDNFEAFGWDVAISGEWVVVGKSNEADQPGGTQGGNTGSAYFFKWENNQWTEKQKVYASDFDQNSFFGRSISIEGRACVIGAGKERKDANGNAPINVAGAAYVFELDGNDQWQEVAKLAGTERNFNDNFGEAVAISGRNIAVGAWQADSVNGTTINDGGTVYVFDRDRPLAVERPHENQLFIVQDRSASAELTIVDRSFSSEPMHIEVITLGGQQVHGETMPPSQACVIHLPHLSEGIYFVRARRGNSFVKAWQWYYSPY